MIKAVGKYVIVKEVSLENTTPSGIVLPDDTKEFHQRTWRFKVISNGPDSGLDLKIGDIVIADRVGPIPILNPFDKAKGIYALKPELIVGKVPK